jgi:hypothetical protein
MYLRVKLEAMNIDTRERRHWRLKHDLQGFHRYLIPEGIVMREQEGNE